MEIVGRDGELGRLGGVLEAARAGRGATLCLVGDAGVGKSTLLQAVHDAAPDFLRVRTTGIETELRLAHGNLLDVVRALESALADVPPGQRRALDLALGLATGTVVGDRHYLVAAATLSLLTAAAVTQPVLLLVDDLQWVDAESVAALTFAARRISNDPVVVLFAGRDDTPAGLAPGVPRVVVGGLAAREARRVVAAVRADRLADPVLDQLVRATDGNPLALVEIVGSLTPAQLRGSAPLPDDPALGPRLTQVLLAPTSALSPDARRAVVLVAASGEDRAAPVVAALIASGSAPEPALAEAERAGLLVLGGGRVAFRHPLVRTAVWGATDGADRRAAHGWLAAALDGDPPRQLVHLAAAATGYDDALAGRLGAESARARARHGYVTAAALAERAASLSTSAADCATHRASAVEDAFVAGAAERVWTVAALVLGGAPGGSARARALLTLGTLEEYTGSVPRARELLTEAAAVEPGPIRLRALAELVMVGYRLGDPTSVAEAAAGSVREAHADDPEQEMLACYCQGAAAAFGGQWVRARTPLSRALELLEGDPRLRADPRHLSTALLTAGWMGEPERVATFLDRRFDDARARGALGVLPLALSLVAGGAMGLDRHDIAYGHAGEAVELGTELGYVADVAIAHEVLAWQYAARGVPARAIESATEARRLGGVAGVGTAAVQIDLVDSFAALCRGDLPTVVAVLERRLVVDDGRRPRGDYPLSVVPDLVEALVTRHVGWHRDTDDPDIRGHVARLRGLVATDDAAADVAFAEAHDAHDRGTGRFEGARTRLLHGSRLRRAGQRVAARDQLRRASAVFTALGLDGWRTRADDELAAAGATQRRPGAATDGLTSQETRVAVLIARGLSNREIAATLFLSPKTIERHVSAALAKRGFRSRTELAVAYAVAAEG